MYLCNVFRFDPFWLSFYCILHVSAPKLMVCARALWYVAHRDGIKTPVTLLHNDVIGRVVLAMQFKIKKIRAEGCPEHWLILFWKVCQRSLLTNIKASNILFLEYISPNIFKTVTKFQIVFKEKEFKLQRNLINIKNKKFDPSKRRLDKY